MNGVWKVTRLTLAASVACVGWVAAHAQAVGQKEIAGIDKRYAIASERVGEDTVKLHSRQDNDAGSVHQIHVFSCVDETFEVVFEGEVAPGVYPDAGDKTNYQALEQNSEQRKLAAHACQEHGFPALRMEW